MLFSCTGKDPVPENFTAPVIEEVRAARGADYSEVIITCRVSSMEGIKEYGLMFGKDNLLAVPAENLSGNTFSVSIRGLSYSTTYHYQGYIDSGGAKSFSAAGVWTTDDEIPPAPVFKTVTPLPAPDAGTVRFSLIIPGWSDVVQKEAVRCGICYSQENGEPTLADLKAEAPTVTEDGESGVQIANLVRGSSYHFRAYSELGPQVSYGKPVTVNIPSSKAVVVTIGAESVITTSALLCGAVSADYISQVSSYGFEWGDGKKLPASGMDLQGNFSLQKALIPGRNYSFRAFAFIGNEFFYGETASFSTPGVVVPETGYVDLGLSVLWATQDIGADDSYGEGDLFAWGETEPKSSNYKWYSDGIFTKYNATDGLTELEPEDDAATANCGSPWRTPTLQDWEDISEYCGWYQLLDGGEHTGYMAVSKIDGYTDRAIYFPRGGLYMTSTLHSVSEVFSFSPSAWTYYQQNAITHRRRDQFSFYVRPVRDRNPNQTNQ